MKINFAVFMVGRLELIRIVIVAEQQPSTLKGRIA